MPRTHCRAIIGLFVVMMAAVSWAAPDEKVAPKDGQGVVVLDTPSVWRIYEALQAPVMQFDEGANSTKWRVK